MGRLIRDHDWAHTPLGPKESWPQPLRFALGIALGSSFPTAIYWGRDYCLLYNDAWSSIPAERHPSCLGRPAREVWPEIWDVIEPQLNSVMDSGEGFATYDQLLMMVRGGIARETYWNYSFTPIRNEYGTVVGILNQGNESTRLVLAERERRAEATRLRDLFEQAPGAVALVHGAGHRVEIANPSFRALVGPRQLVDRALAEAIPELEGQGLIRDLDQVLETGVPMHDARRDVRLLVDGAREVVRTLDIVMQPIRDSDGAISSILIQADDVTQRMATETALRKSEERLELALDASTGIGTWDWDATTGRVTGDARFARLFGLEGRKVEEGTTAQDFFDHLHPDDRQVLRDAILAASSHDGVFASEFRVRAPDGATRWILSQGRCRFDEGGSLTRIIGVGFDITDRKATEQQAHDAMEELRRTTEAQAFLHALSDRQRSMESPEAVMVHTAAALARRLDCDRVIFSRVEGDRIVLGSRWMRPGLELKQEILPIESIGEMGVAFRRGVTAVRCENAQGAVDPSARADDTGPYDQAIIGVPLLRGGQWVAGLYVGQQQPRQWTADEISLVEAAAESSWDAVERVRAAVALVESEAKFRAIANSIEQMIWSTRPDGYHDYFNQRWYEFTGVPDGTTDGEGWNDVFHPDDQDRARARWTHCLTTGEPYHIEYRLRHRSGEYRWVLGRAQPVCDESGRITRWFGTCTDIPEIVDAREVLARSREELEAAVEQRTHQLMATEAQLRQAQKMEAVGQLTGGIAHDFNNMLAVVIGGLDLLERRLARGDTDVGRYVAAARDGATRAAALTQRLLAFSRRQPLAPAAVNVNALVNGMIDLLSRTLGEAVQIETDLAPDLPSAVADPSQLENVIVNLGVNARDAMPGGGRLTIRTHRAVLSEEDARRHELPMGVFVCISVTDTGIGMPPEIAARAFDPFFTTKGLGQGTGLGLSQVFGFARQSGGQVRIDTAEGKGTTVHMLLPAATASSAAAPAPAPHSAPPKGGSPDEVVLVVEDEERVRSYSVEALRDLGYTVVHAPDGLEALRMIECGQGATLLFTDMVMPEMTGRELAKRAQALIPGLKVLFTSGYTNETAREAAEREGEGAILPKPFDVDRLARAVRAAIDG